MFGSTVALTLATLAGLAAGLAREWLVIDSWGVGARTDALLVALFLPEAIRMTLAGGLLPAAALPLWQALEPSRRASWLAGQVRAWALLGVVLAVAIAGLAPWLVRIVGSGLSAENAAAATQMLRALAWVIPALLVHALLTVPMQAHKRFLLPGLGSLLFNAPPVLYLFAAGTAAEPLKLSLCFVAGSVAMACALIPSVWGWGWRPFARGDAAGFTVLWRKLWPLLASSSASQGLVLVERMVGSWLGEGTITLVNLARKLIGLPLVALMSLNQVLLQQMSAREGSDRLQTLRRGLDLCSALTLPSMVFVAGAAPSLVALLLPGRLDQGPLPALLAVMSASLIPGSWNALLARFRYAGGDTRGPLRYELMGSAAQVGLLLSLPAALGILGFGAAALGGTLLTAVLLSRSTDLEVFRHLVWQTVIGALIFGATVGLLFFNLRDNAPSQIAAAALAALIVLAGLMLAGRHGASRRVSAAPSRGR